MFIQEGPFLGPNGPGEGTGGGGARQLKGADVEDSSPGGRGVRWVLNGCFAMLLGAGRGRACGTGVERVGEGAEGRLVGRTSKGEACQ